MAAFVPDMFVCYSCVGLMVLNRDVRAAHFLNNGNGSLRIPLQGEANPPPKKSFVKKLPPKPKKKPEAESCNGAPSV